MIGVVNYLDSAFWCREDQNGYTVVQPYHEHSQTSAKVQKRLLREFAKAHSFVIIAWESHPGDPYDCIVATLKECGDIEPGKDMVFEAMSAS